MVCVASRWRSLGFCEPGGRLTTVNRTVEGTEKTKTSAGEFEAYSIASTESIVSKGKERGAPWPGTANYKYYVTSIKDKLVPLKIEYSNSFGEAYTSELASAELK
jgi:hypothetical protein